MKRENGDGRSGRCRREGHVDDVDGAGNYRLSSSRIASATCTTVTMAVMGSAGRVWQSIYGAAIFPGLDLNNAILANGHDPCQDGSSNFGELNSYLRVRPCL